MVAAPCTFSSTWAALFIAVALLLPAPAVHAAQQPAGGGGGGTQTDAFQGTAHHVLAAISQRLRGLQTAGSINSCLSAVSGLDYQAPGASAFATASSVWNLRVLTSPALVTFPRTVDQVSKIVKCAKQFGKKVVPRSGGHSYEGYSVQPDKVTVDLSSMTAVTLNASTGMATIQAGAKLGPIYKALWDQGQRTIPAGTCPTVGIGGHIQGGGYGMLARKYGLTLDRLVGVEMVDAGGAIVTANRTHNADLLWACKGGGGGNWGIFTNFVVQTVGVPRQVTAITITWAASSTPAAIQWYQSEFVHLTNDISSDLFIGYGSVELHALYLGPAAQARSVLAASNLLPTVGQPLQENYDQMSYIDAVVEFGNQAEALQPQLPSSLALGAGVQLNPPSSFKAKSNFVKQPMSAAGVALAASKIAAATSQGIGGWMQFHGYGGAINAIPAANTAFVHRSTLASIQFYVSWTSASNAQRSTAWLQDFWTSMRPHVDQSAYQNYIDRDLGASSLAAYYGSNLDRLVAIKKKFDPASYFNYPFSIPTVVPAG